MESQFAYTLSPPRIVIFGRTEAMVSQNGWGKFWLMQLPNAIRVRGSLCGGRGANSIVILPLLENKDGDVSSPCSVLLLSESTSALIIIINPVPRQDNADLREEQILNKDEEVPLLLQNIVVVLVDDGDECWKLSSDGWSGRE